MTVLEVIQKRQEKYKLQMKPSQAEICRHGYDSAWWALEDLREIIDQNGITDVFAHGNSYDCSFKKVVKKVKCVENIMCNNQLIQGDTYDVIGVSTDGFDIFVNIKCLDDIVRSYNIKRFDIIS